MATRRNYQLLIDYDHRSKLLNWLFKRKLEKIMKLLSEICYIHLDRISPIPSFHGFHYYIYIQTNYELTPEQCSIMQAILGDDLMRTIFNLNRMILGWTWKNNNIFFEENELPSQNPKLEQIKERLSCI